MADGPYLLRFERAAHAHDDRGGGLGRFAREQRPLGQHQMDPRRLDAVDRMDGAGKFALQRAQMIDVLDEAGGAERVGLVEDLVADAAALRQAALRQLHPQPGDLVLGHHDRRAVIAQLVGNGLALQVLDDGRGIFEAEFGEQGGQLRRGDAQDDEPEEARERGCHRDHRHQARSTQTL